jgi:hypothetical protein
MANIDTSLKVIDAVKDVEENCLISVPRESKHAHK